MSNEEIHSECLILFGVLAKAQTRLREIRKICKHEKTIEAFFGHTIGHTSYSVVCAYCNEYIKMVDKVQSIS